MLVVGQVHCGCYLSNTQSPVSSTRYFAGGTAEVQVLWRNRGGGSPAGNGNGRQGTNGRQVLQQ